MRDNNLVTIGKLSELSGISKHTLRYYEEQGLIEAIERTSSNYRLFDELKTLKQIEFIKKAQTVNFSLQEIKGLLQIEKPNHPCENVRNLLEDKIAEITKHIDELENIKSFLVVVKDKWSITPDCSNKNQSEYSICKLIESVESLKAVYKQEDSKHKLNSHSSFTTNHKR